MEILMMLLVLAFLAFLGGGVLFLLKDPKETAFKKNPTETKTRILDPTASLKKRIFELEEKLKGLETNRETLQLELSQTKEKENALLQEKSRNSFDADQYEKFKKEHIDLKKELGHKEEMLENEISQRRKEAVELIQRRTDDQQLKKQLSETEDALRKAQTIIETITKDLNQAKRMISDQKKIVQEHHENKAEGEWVSRIEFTKLENELKEKQILMQKLMTLKKDTPQAPLS